jgi:hypothetical protein
MNKAGLLIVASPRRQVRGGFMEKRKVWLRLRIYGGLNCVSSKDLFKS